MKKKWDNIVDVLKQDISFQLLLICIALIDFNSLIHDECGTKFFKLVLQNLGPRVILFLSLYDQERK